MSENQYHVIFGTGPLGLSVMRELVRRGKPAKMVNRSGKAPQGVPAQVSIVAGDGYNLDFTRQVCQGLLV